MTAPMQANEKEHFRAVRGNRWRFGIAFRGDLTVALGVVDPGGAFRCTNRGKKGTPVRSHGDTFFLGRSGGQLFRGAVRETLAPYVKGASGIRAEIHPSPV